METQHSDLQVFPSDSLSAMYILQHKLPQLLPCDVPLSTSPEQGAQLCQVLEEIQCNLWAASTNADHA